MYNIRKEDVDKLFELLIDVINPLLTYEQAAELLGVSKHAVYCKVSRNKVKVEHHAKLIRYSDVLKMRDGKKGK